MAPLIFTALYAASGDWFLIAGVPRGGLRRDDRGPAPRPRTRSREEERLLLTLRPALSGAETAGTETCSSIGNDGSGSNGNPTVHKVLSVRPVGTRGGPRRALRNAGRPRPAGPAPRVAAAGPAGRPGRSRDRHGQADSPAAARRMAALPAGAGPHGPGPAATAAWCTSTPCTTARTSPKWDGSPASEPTESSPPTPGRSGPWPSPASRPGSATWWGRTRCWKCRAGARRAPQCPPDPWRWPATIRPSTRGKSPGGWQLIGRTAARMWDLDREQPALAAPGHRVQFRAVREVVLVAPEHTAAATDAAPGCRPRNLQFRPADRFTRAAEPDPGPRPARPLRPGCLRRRCAGPCLAAPGQPAGGQRSLGRRHRNRGRRTQVQAVGDQVLAVAGAPSALTIDTPSDAESDSDAMSRRDQAHGAHGHPFALLDGETLTLGAPEAGFRSYLAVRGGVDAAPVLGSRSTDTMSGIGPAPLAAGQLLAPAMSPNPAWWEIPNCSRTSRGRRHGAGHRARPARRLVRRCRARVAVRPGLGRDAAVQPGGHAAGRYAAGTQPAGRTAQRRHRGRSPPGPARRPARALPGRPSRSRAATR